MNNLLILIPSYNPDGSLIKLIEKLLEKNFVHILVVDDGSSKTSSYIFQSEVIKKCHILHLPTNSGKGHALKAGFKHILKHFNQVNWIICCDDDLQHSPDDILKVYEKTLNCSSNNIILGVRNFNSQVPLKSRLGNSVMHWLFRLKYKQSIPDTQTGLRAIPYNILSDLIQLKGEFFYYEQECLKHFIKNYQLHFVEIEAIYYQANKNTRFNPIIDSAKNIYNFLFEK